MNERERMAWGGGQQAATRVVVDGELLAAGSAVVPAGTYGAARTQFGGLQWSAQNGKAKVCTLQISNPTSDYWTEVAANVGAANLCGGVFITYGAGAAARTVLCDWKTGAIQLPPCGFVKAGVWASSNSGTVTVPIPWLNTQLALTEGFCPEADTPTFTFKGLTTGAWGVPTLARSAQIVTPGTAVFDNGVTVSLVAGALTPPYTPVRLPGVYSFNYTADAVDTAGVLIFLLDL